MKICVVGRLHREVSPGDAAKGGVAGGELHCRVGLKEHASFQPVEIQACHGRAFVGLGGFLLDNRGEGGYLGGSHAEIGGALSAAFVPESVAHFEHPFRQPFAAVGPVGFVCVGHECCRELLTPEPVAWQEGVACLKKFFGADLYVAGYFRCHIGEIAGIVECHLHGRLCAVFKASGCAGRACRMVEPVGSMGARGCASHGSPDGVHAVAACDAKCRAQRVGHGCAVGARGYSHPSRLIGGCCGFHAEYQASYCQ